MRILTNRRKSWPFNQIFQIFRNVILASENISYNSIYNGEKAVFEILSNHNFSKIIDCGANVGTSIDLFKSIQPNCKIYALEAIDETFEICKKNTAHYSKVEYFNIGLGAKNETVSFSFSSDDNSLSTRYEITNKRQLTKVEKQVKILTGADFLNQEGITAVDFIKIDVEGMDFDVIKGFETFLLSKKIKALQFEYSNHFIYAGHFLKDVFDYFKNKGYILGKIYPNGVDFREYHPEMEDFKDANYLIIDESFNKIIKELREQKR